MALYVLLIQFPDMERECVSPSHQEFLRVFMRKPRAHDLARVHDLTDAQLRATLLARSAAGAAPARKFARGGVLPRQPLSQAVVHSSAPPSCPSTVPSAAAFAPPAFARRGLTTMGSGEGTAGDASPVTGHPPGPYPIACTTIQLDDHSRRDPDQTTKPRRLQTEIWFPATEEARGAPTNRYSDYLGRGAIQGSIAAAEAPNAIGGYRDGLTVAELDRTWPNAAVRDARPLEPPQGEKWPLVVFSHGSGAFRASYIYFTEFLASHGFVVMACDHLGSARYTQVDGEVITPGGKRSERKQMEADRPIDLRFLIDSMQRLSSSGGDSRFAGRVDCSNTAVTGMSFGGFASAAVLEYQDPRVKAAILQCPSIGLSGGPWQERANTHTPILMMTGREDTVIGEVGNTACHQYYDSHTGPKCLVELVKGGHVSFTSCELYNKEYGNGIGSSSKSLTQPGTTYTPTPIIEQHAIINAYALAFLDTYLRGSRKSSEYIGKNHFGGVIEHRFSDPSVSAL